MSATQSSEVELDAIFAHTVSEISLKHSLFLPKHLMVRVRLWLQKLSLAIADVRWKRLRNEYAALLSDRCACRVFSAPFDKQPPDGPLPRIPLSMLSSLKNAPPLVTATRQRFVSVLDRAQTCSGKALKPASAATADSQSRADSQTAAEQRPTVVAPANNFGSDYPRTFIHAAAAKTSNSEAFSISSSNVKTRSSGSLYRPVRSHPVAHVLYPPLPDYVVPPMPAERTIPGEAEALLPVYFGDMSQSTSMWNRAVGNADLRLQDMLDYYAAPRSCRRGFRCRQYSAAMDMADLEHNDYTSRTLLSIGGNDSCFLTRTENSASKPHAHASSHDFASDATHAKRGLSHASDVDIVVPPISVAGSTRWTDNSPALLRLNAEIDVLRAMVDHHP